MHFGTTKGMPTITSAKKRKGMNFVNGVNPFDQMTRFLEIPIMEKGMDSQKDQRKAEVKVQTRRSRGERTK